VCSVIFIVLETFIKDVENYKRTLGHPILNWIDEVKFFIESEGEN
jgi:hypothetical protein